MNYSSEIKKSMKMLSKNRKTIFLGQSVEVPGNLLFKSLEFVPSSKKCNPCPTQHLTSSEVLKLRDQVFHDYYHNQKILKMIERKFGKQTLDHITEMLKTPLERDIFNKENKSIIPAGGFVAQGISIPKPKYKSLVV